MNLRKIGFGAWLCMPLFVISCSDDNEPGAGQGGEMVVEWGIPESEQPLVVVSEGKEAIPFKASHLKAVTWGAIPQGWEISVNEFQDTVWVTAPAYESASTADCDITLKLTGLDGKEVGRTFKFHWIKAFDDPRGTFVLNEGNMTTENGSLIYISPEGYVLDKAYRKVNGTELGNVCQDMAFYDGKIYIISQNGDENAVGSKFENDGMLVILDAKTLKKKDAYTKEDLKELSWPSHIAVLDDEHVYIRDNGVKEGDNGSGKVWRLNTKNRKLVEVKNTLGAPKSPLYVVNNKVYTYNITKSEWAEKMNVLQISASSDEAVGYYRSLFDSGKPVSVVPSKEENAFWVLFMNEEEQYAISKARLPKYGIYLEVSSSKPFEEDYVPNDGASGVRLVPEKDIVGETKVGSFYFSTGTCIARATYTEKYSGATNEAELLTEDVVELSDLDENARLIYNGLAIHPITGHLFVNTLKGMGGLYTTNSIWEFALGGETPKKLNQWNNYTKFPAGFFFPMNNTSVE